MDQFPEYEFKALAKMSSHQIKNYYSTSKIFMDLGIHPQRKNANKGSCDGMYFDCGKKRIHIK